MRRLTWPALMLLAACGQLPKNVYLPDVVYKDFVPIDPVEYPHQIEVYDSAGLTNAKSIRAMKSHEVLKTLVNETVLVVVAELTNDGSLSYGPAKLSRKNSQYLVTMDYMKYTTVGLSDTAGPGARLAGTARLGVGLRIRASITSKTDNVNLADLFSIGLAAQRGQLFGTMAIEVIGIQSPEVTATIPLPSEISRSSIQAAMQAMATIKSKIHDPDTWLTPQITAVKSERDSVGTVALKESIIRRQQELIRELNEEIPFNVPTTFRGVWQGTATQDTLTFQVKISLSEQSATIEYADLACSGVLTMLASDQSQQLRLREHILVGIEKCINFGSIRLSLSPDGAAASFDYYRPDGREAARGVLHQVSDP